MDPILVWDWQDAPEEFRQLSSHGGDEDYVIAAPVEYDCSYMFARLVQGMDVCGDADPDQAKKVNYNGMEYVVVITAHS